MGGLRGTIFGLVWPLGEGAKTFLWAPIFTVSGDSAHCPEADVLCNTLAFACPEQGSISCVCCRSCFASLSAPAELSTVLAKSCFSSFQLRCPGDRILHCARSCFHESPSGLVSCDTVKACCNSWVDQPSAVKGRSYVV